MNRKIFLIFLPFLIAGCKAADQKIITRLPTVSPLVDSSFACSAIISTDTWRDPSEGMNIVTTTKEGTDQLAISIEGETMAFNTRAAVEAGMPSAATFHIFQNNDDSLISAYLEPSGYSMNTFTLNKKTGLAVWTKTRPEFPTTDAPTADTIYLHCK